MRTTQYLLSTLRESPAEAETISHQLMLRSGMIRKLASGLYTWLPTGLRVLQKVEAIIRDEMNKTGAHEVLMPVVQPAELWEESGRWQQYGPELLRITDRHQRSFCLGPTHEEVITDLARNQLHSYKQLPANFYQIQTKFRDEIRPRFGVMRSREFIMKDAYSFHIDSESLQQTYDKMYQAYSNIFSRIGLEFRAVIADTGSIGGSTSHEFHVLASSGEDAIAFSDGSNYAANVEMAEALATDENRPAPTQNLEEVDTPNQHSIDEVSQFLQVPAKQILKTLIVLGSNEDSASKESSEDSAPLVALILRGDHSLNDIKAEKFPGVHQPLTFASEEKILASLGCHTGSIGPKELIDNSSVSYIYVDQSAALLNDFVCGANKDGKHYKGANWERDYSLGDIVDLRNVENGDPSPDGKGQLQIKRGIEVGHIFQLGTKYSEAMNANVLNEKGKATAMSMGCYGIGVTRIVAAAIEQNYDDKGIIWPESIAPFQVVLVPMNLHKSERVRKTSEELYNTLQKNGIEVLFDDRNERPGVKFADAELIGIPHRVVIGEKSLEKGKFEYRSRSENDNQEIDVDTFIDFICEQLSLRSN